MPANPLLLATELQPKPAEQFDRLAREYCQLIGAHGPRVDVSRDPSLPHFRAASRKVQHWAVAYLGFNVEILRQMASAGESPKETRKYLWRALLGLNLVPPADGMEYINNEDIVEIYFLDEFQAFRNLRFFELTSFTVEEMLCLPWYKNVSRHWRPWLKMARMVLRMRMGKLLEISEWNVPPHEVVEKPTAQKIRFRMTLKHMIPLRSNGRVAAALSTNYSEVLS